MTLVHGHANLMPTADPDDITSDSHLESVVGAGVLAHHALPERPNATNLHGPGRSDISCPSDVIVLAAGR